MKSVRQSTSATTGRVLLVASVQDSEQLFEQANRLIKGGAQIVEQHESKEGLWSKVWIVLQPAREAMQTQLF